MSRKAIAFLLILLLGSIGAARSNSEVIEHVDVGFAGAYKAGLWTPVRVHFAPEAKLDGAQVSLIVPDGDDVPSRVSAVLPSPAPKSILLYARFGRIRSPLTVRVERSGELVAERKFQASDTPTEKNIPVALRSSQPLVVVVGRKPLGIADAITRMREPEGSQTQLARVEDAATLPDRWYGYEGVSLVVLSGTDVECYAGLAADDPRIDALSRWVRRGGRLLVAVGEYGDDLLADGKPLSSLLPGKFEKTVSLSQARDLERLAGTDESLPSRVDGKALQVAQLTAVDGLVVARAGNLPLVVSRVWEFGRMTYLASDLDRGPLGQWDARPAFVASLLDWPVKPVEIEDSDKTILHYGYTDLAGQLRSALDQFEGVSKISFAWIAAAIVLYLLLIGPGDYFFVRKVLRRMELTWVTFPATVILFCVAAYFVAHRTKGDQFRVNQATLIDIDVETGQLRGTTWANVFSPETRRVDVRFAVEGRQNNPDSDVALLTAWLGLPGKALGGMDPLTSSATAWSEPWTRPYDFKDDAAWLANMPLQVWSSKSLTARWNTTFEAAFDCDLEEKGPIPSGYLTSNLDMPLSDCMLVYGNWIYELGTLAPGERVRVGVTLKRRELASFLTGRKIVFDEEEERAMQRVTRYSVDSTDPEYVLRAMTFFQAAGGKPYTHLDNHYQGFVDMSDLLKPDRAVLIAKAAGSGDDRPQPWDARISLTSGGESIPLHEKHTTLLRFVLNVVPDER